MVFVCRLCVGPPIGAVIQKLPSLVHLRNSHYGARPLAAPLFPLVPTERAPSFEG